MLVFLFGTPNLCSLGLTFPASRRGGRAGGGGAAQHKETGPRKSRVGCRELLSLTEVSAEGL